MARAMQTLSEIPGRTQTPRNANVVVYMGPAAHTPLLSEMLGKLLKRVAERSKPKVLPPPYGGEQGRKGKGFPNPSKGFRCRSPGPYGGAAVSIGGVETGHSSTLISSWV